MAAHFCSVCQMFRCSSASFKHLKVQTIGGFICIVHTVTASKIKGNSLVKKRNIHFAVFTYLHFSLWNFCKETFSVLICLQCRFFPSISYREPILFIWIASWVEWTAASQSNEDSSVRPGLMTRQHESLSVFSFVQKILTPVDRYSPHMLN